MSVGRDRPYLPSKLFTSSLLTRTDTPAAPVTRRDRAPQGTDPRQGPIEFP